MQYEIQIPGYVVTFAFRHRSVTIYADDAAVFRGRYYPGLVDVPDRELAADHATTAAAIAANGELADPAAADWWAANGDAVWRYFYPVAQSRPVAAYPGGYVVVLRCRLEVNHP